MVLLLGVLALAGLVMIALSYVVVADAQDALESADNQCAYVTQQPTTPSDLCTTNGFETPTYCGDGYLFDERDDGASIVQQAYNACNNASASAAVLSATGGTIAVTSLGCAGAILFLRRMDRVETEAPPPT